MPPPQAMTEDGIEEGKAFLNAVEDIIVVVLVPVSSVLVLELVDFFWPC